MNSSYQTSYSDPATPYDQDFWDNYAVFLLKQSISKKYINWYVLRTKQYIAAFPEIFIRQHPHQQIEGYINTKAQDIQLKSWQFAQVIDALRILFSLGLKANWAKEYDWEYLKTSAQPLSASHPTVARDYTDALATLPKHQPKAYDPAVKKRYEPVVAEVIKVIRLKNYSIRTEKTYTHSWQALCMAAACA